jgi:hypothetical protein
VEHRRQPNSRKPTSSLDQKFVANKSAGRFVVPFLDA